MTEQEEVKTNIRECECEFLSYAINACLNETMPERWEMPERPWGGLRDEFAAVLIHIPREVQVRIRCAAEKMLEAKGIKKDLESHSDHLTTCLINYLVRDGLRYEAFRGMLDSKAVTITKIETEEQLKEAVDKTIKDIKTSRPGGGNK